MIFKSLNYLIVAFFVLCSDITIGSFRFSGVHDVRVKRSIHSYADSAVITLPAMCKIRKGNNDALELTVTSEQFKENDPVIINLGYNNEQPPIGKVTPARKWNDKESDGNTMFTVFQGFVKKIGIGTPIQVECEGYVRKLRQDVQVKRSSKNAKVSEVLKLLETGKDGAATGIKVHVEHDMGLSNLKLSNKNGVEVIEEIKRLAQGVLTIFFIEPNKLWCGLTYSPFSEGDSPFELGEISYRLGYNVVKDNSLNIRKVGAERVKVIVSGTDAAGNKISAESGDKDAHREQKLMVSGIADKAGLKMIANERQLKENYDGYEGSITTFGEPFVTIADNVSLIDNEYPERAGSYKVKAVTTKFDNSGYRRQLTLAEKAD